jgi:hypothetical protein
VFIPFLGTQNLCGGIRIYFIIKYFFNFDIQTDLPELNYRQNEYINYHRNKIPQLNSSVANVVQFYNPQYIPLTLSFHLGFIRASVHFLQLNSKFQKVKSVCGLYKLV